MKVTLAIAMLIASTAVFAADLPDPKLTPGVVDPSLTPEIVGRRGWSTRWIGRLYREIRSALSFAGSGRRQGTMPLIPSAWCGPAGGIGGDRRRGCRRRRLRQVALPGLRQSECFSTPSTCSSWTARTGGRDRSRERKARLANIRIAPAHRRPGSRSRIRTPWAYCGSRTTSRDRSRSPHGGLWLRAAARQPTALRIRSGPTTKVATGVAIVVFWPAAFFVGGDGPTAAELANLKGQMTAIERASIQKKCGIQFQRETPQG
jgi:hypothetical protein